MKIITAIKRLFRKSKNYQVWDTSALSNYFEAFKNVIKAQADVTVVIPEGVSHEISVGRRNNDNCKEIYKFIEGNIRNPRLILEVTPDNIRSWQVDEQVIYTAEKYNIKGYTTTLITCDRDQSFRAKLKGLDTKLVPVKSTKVQDELADEKDEQSVKARRTSIVVPVKDSKKTVDETIIEEKNEFELPSRMVGKECWLGFDKNISVYDCKGKRRIFRKEGVAISLYDLVYYKETAYYIKNIGKTSVTLVKKSV